MTLGMFDFRRSGSLGISDDQERNEVAAQRRFFSAVREMRPAIDDVNTRSVVVEIEPSAFDNFLNDECPTPDYWDERVASKKFP